MATSFDPVPIDMDFIFVSCPSGPVVGARRQQMMSMLDPAIRSDPDTASVVVWIVDFLMKELPDKHSGILIWAPNLDWATANWLHDTIRDPHRTSPSLAVAAGRFLSVNGLPELFDLDEGVFLKQLPCDIFESRIFNLRMLHNSCLNRRENNGPRSRPSLV